MFRLHDVILLGVGYWQYQENPNLYTKMLLKNVLNPNVLLSVRDEYTEKMLKAAGIENVINTGCPTMWKLTKEVVDKIQAVEDYEQQRRMGYEDKVHIILPTLKVYSSVLENLDDVDYVGTRLHVGIHALNKGRRSLIIVVDNREVEISRDTGLPVIKQENVKQELEHMICDSWKTEIVLPLENIEKWKKQFKFETFEFRGG